MRILKALSIIDDAVYLCKEKSVDTPEINAALDLLQVQLLRMRQQIEAFRAALNLQKYGADGLEMQHRELRERMPPIQIKGTDQDAGISLQGQARRQNESGE